MFTIRMAEISEHAGNAGDGIVRGQIAQSLSNDVYTSIEATETVYAFNLDLAGGSIDFTPYTTEATSGVPNSFLPWGTDVSFSLGDCLYIANDEPCTQVRFTINTGAVWVSTAAPGDQLEIRDSTNGTSPNRTLTVTTDTSNGFRNTGTVQIIWTDPAISRVAWTPVPGLIAARNWICISPKDYVSSTTSPKMSMTYMLGSGNDMVNLTSTFNGPWLTPVPNVFPDVVYLNDSSMLYTFAAPGPGIDFRSYLKSANYYTYVWEYYSVTGVWKPFANVVDPSDGLKNGPASYGDPAVEYHVRWQLPSDWDLMPLVIPTDPGPTTTINGAHMRMRIVTVTNIAPTPPPLARARCRSLNSAGGVYHTAQGIYNALTFEATIPAASNTSIQLFNGTTYSSAIAVFPSLTYSSCNTALQRLVLSTPLTINSGQALFITWQGGDTLQDVEIVLE